ncbi:MAG TPA: DUF4286 family protein [Chitinophagaceae bacterium]|nr:DUF4286 family protein [Chitinophagaceae bacterium]
MIVYNISMKVDLSIEKEWVAWQKNEHIPDIMATGQFTDYKFYRLLEEENDAATYVIQYFAPDIQHYNKYMDSFAVGLRKKAFDKWGNKFIAFRSVMQVVN